MENDMFLGTMKPLRWISWVALLGLVLALIGVARAADLTDKQMLDVATARVAKDVPKAAVAPIQSKNPHLGNTQVPCPLPDYRFFCTTRIHACGTGPHVSCGQSFRASHLSGDRREVCGASGFRGQSSLEG
jgi:hypothetical protein